MLKHEMAVPNHLIVEETYIKDSSAGRCRYWLKYIVMVIILTTILGIALVLCLCPYFATKTEVPSKNTQTVPSKFINIEPAIVRNFTIEGIVPRAEWHAEPSISSPNLLRLPVFKVIFHLTETQPCFSKDKCIAITRTIQALHINSRGWWDIGYNFLIGGDGRVYEGRGWTQEGAHTYGLNKESLGVAFIGSGTIGNVTPNIFPIGQYLINEGVQLGYISSEYKVYGRRLSSNIESKLKRFEHWEGGI